MEVSAADRLLATAVTCLAAGDYGAALHAASEACHEAPEHAEPHYAYGQAWAALGENARAEEAFAAALQRAPNWPDAWINWGIARYRQNAMGDATMAMREALLRDPGNTAASANLAAFLRLTGEPDEAERLLHEVIASDPADAAARLNLAADLLREERAADALALLEGEVPPDLPAARQWYLQRALTMLQLGRNGDARAELDAFSGLGPVPPALAPLWHWRHVLLALGEGDATRASIAASAMETALDAMGPDSVPEHRLMARYDLAKFHSGRGEHARAFAHWAAAHRQLAKVQPFSRTDHLAVIEANIASFDHVRFATGPRAANHDPTPVFIVGMPRSGTTLCEQILSAHSDVHGAGERAALGGSIARLSAGIRGAGAVRRIASLTADELEKAATAYLSELHALAPGKARIVDKMPGNYMNLGLIGLMLPGARIIHCVRDPRDIGLSIFTFRFHGVHPYAHDLGDLGWTIAQQAKLMDHWKQVLPNPILTVALRDWVADFDETLSRLLDHLGLFPDERCARFYESDRRVKTASRAQVRQPINARGIGRWRPYAKPLAPLVAELRAAGLISADDPDGPRLRLVKPDDPARSLAMAVPYLMGKPAFADLSFGHWAKVLVGQAGRGTCCFLLDECEKVQGFAGWTVTSRTHAETWLSNITAQPENEVTDDSCVIVNALAGESSAAVQRLVNEMRAVVEPHKTVYFRRHFADGKWRSVRLRVTPALLAKLERFLEEEPSASPSRPRDRYGTDLSDS